MGDYDNDEILDRKLDVSGAESIADAALAYVDRGLVVIPIKCRDKIPLIRQWQTLTLKDVDVERNFPVGTDHNIGVVLGAASGGLVDIDLDCVEAVRIAPLLLPSTGMIFGRKGLPASHYIYRVSDCEKVTRFSGTQNDGTLVEYRGNGGQTVFPPSIHLSGESIRFEKDGEPTSIKHSQLIACVGKVAAAALLAKNWAEGRRHDMAMALSGALLSRSWTQLATEHFLKAVCVGASDTECKDRIKTVATTMQAIQKGQPVTGYTRLQEFIGTDAACKVADWLNLDVHQRMMGHNSNGRTDGALRYTDIGNADKFIESYGDQFLYCYELGTWLCWRGTRWTIGDKASVERSAEATIRSFEQEANDLSDDRKRTALLDWVKRSGNRGHIRAMCEQARHHVSIDQSKLDAQSSLINVRGNVVDLRTGEVRPIKRQDYITKSVGTDYDVSAQCPQFEAFLDRAMDGSKELISYLQRAVGYSLTGDTREQCFFIAHGSGANGKSVFLNLIGKLMGQYALTTPMNSLVNGKTNSGASNDIARLRGSRFVFASEAEANQKIKDSLIKQLTGGDSISARFLFQEYFEFIPSFKLWMATNHKPRFSGDDPAIWRRIHLIPFNVVIPVKEQDRELCSKLETELPGILNWAIQGSVDWYRKGLVRLPKFKQQRSSIKVRWMDFLGFSMMETSLRKLGVGSLKQNCFWPIVSSVLTRE